MDNKKPIRKLSINEIEDIVIGLGEKKFRIKQIVDWLWNKSITSFDQMQNLPTKIIEHLDNNFTLTTIEISKTVKSKDGTVKFLFQTKDTNSFFEGVLIKSSNRMTACLSTQVGCKLACNFCESGHLGFEKDLTVSQIFEQFILMNSYHYENTGKRIDNIVIMGMGEPLLNYKNTLNFINHITSDYSFGFSPKRITLSTAGIAPQIIQMANDDVKFNLAISLHSAINKKRDLIMKINKKYNLDQLKEAIIYFHKKTGSRITYEYLLLKDINDSIADAQALSVFTKITPCKINIIEYNQTSTSKFQPSSIEKMNKFCEFLTNKNLIVNIRQSKGADIQAACGQLAKKST